MGGGYLFERVLTKLFYAVGALALALMMLFTVTDVALRYLGRPIIGSNDVISVIGLIVISLGIPETTRINGHVYVDLLSDKAGGCTKKILFIFTKVLAVCLFLLLSYGGIEKGYEFSVKHEASQTLHISLSYVIYAFAVCCLLQCVSLVSQLVYFMRRGVEIE
jgi:TRAP-type C4-dicarboxylate transport system permease small subunit